MLQARRNRGQSGPRSLLEIIHCMKVWIYNILTTDQMWCTCVCKYGICDISTIVNKSFMFIVLMSHIPYTFAPYLISSKYIVNPNSHAV